MGKPKELIGTENLKSLFLNIQLPKKKEKDKLEKAIQELKIKDLDKKEIQSVNRLIELFENSIPSVTFNSTDGNSSIGVAKRGITLRVGEPAPIKENEIIFTEDLFSKENATLNFVLGTFLANIDTKKEPLNIKTNFRFEIPKKELLIQSQVKQDFIKKINPGGIKSSITGLRVTQQIDKIKHDLTIDESGKKFKISSKVEYSTVIPAINLKDLTNESIKFITIVLTSL